MKLILAWLCYCCSAHAIAAELGSSFRTENSIAVPTAAAGLPETRANRSGLREPRGLELVLAASRAAGSPLYPTDRSVLRFLAVCDELEVASAEAAHRLLHERLLTGRFRSELSNVAQTLEHGDYNCLTAAILYKAICDLNGVAIVVCGAPGHVACQKLDGTPLEPTCRDWFDPRACSRVEAGCGPRAPGRLLSSLGLLARVHFNRGIEELSKGDYERALDQFRLAQRHDPEFSEAGENELAALNNWALELCDRGNFEEAAERLQQARNIDASYPTLAANDRHVMHVWTTDLCREGNYPQALKLLSAGRLRQPGAPLFVQGPTAIAHAWIVELLNAGQISAAREALDQTIRDFPEVTVLRGTLRWESPAAPPSAPKK